MKNISIILFVVFASFGCTKDEPGGSLDPQNLAVEVIVSDRNTGLVAITATADNTTEYHFYLGDNGAGQPIIQNEGELSYTYSSSGVFLVEVRAYGASGRFVKKDIQITVIVNDGTEPDDGYTTPPSYEGMTLLWSDEFNGSMLNESDWTYELGTGNNGWGNNELQYYRKENTSVSGGNLTIEARKETYSGNEYTSSRMVTKGNISFKYGRVDIRAKLPKGQGLWPALWMLGSNIDQAGWPACGEIDIMELVGNEPDEVHGTIHYGPPWPNNQQSGTGYQLSSGDFNEKYHVFTLIWNENQLKWYVDDNIFLTLTPSNISPQPWLFNQNFFFIFNVAVGGNWPGSPDSSTVFPQQMVVDYIRVFQPN